MRTDAERDDPQNYRDTIQVRSQCLLTEAQDPENGRCEMVIPPRVLAPDEWVLELGHEECAGQSLIRLVDPPPAGSEIFVEFFVDVAPADIDTPSRMGQAEGSTPMQQPSADPNQEMMPPPMEEPAPSP